ncbi:hypothetical protein IJH15_03280, partial [Candidatus Saccharibacteria bacterium]|nr:hypothetical protein [Candidatus Saccharibacteria bacterium]
SESGRGSHFFDKKSSKSRLGSRADALGASLAGGAIFLTKNHQKADSVLGLMPSERVWPVLVSIFP